MTGVWGMVHVLLYINIWQSSKDDLLMIISTEYGLISSNIWSLAVIQPFYALKKNFDKKSSTSRTVMHLNI